jgi:2-iminobutanoate/2-iminopropanoate deaminase
MPKKKIETKAAPAAIGPYSQAIACGPLLFCSGQIPLDPETMQVVTGDLKVQTTRVLKNLKAVLEASGSSVSKILKTTVFVTDLSKFSALNEEYEAFFKAEAPNVPAPARSTVQVSALPRGVDVEIEVIAEL